MTVDKVSSQIHQWFKGEQETYIQWKIQYWINLKYENTMELGAYAARYSGNPRQPKTEINSMDTERNKWDFSQNHEQTSSFKPPDES